MSPSESLLPPEFADLEAHACVWALPSFDARMQLRAAASMADIQAFYDAMQPRADAALVYLEQFPLNDMPPPAHRLMHLLFALTQAAMAVEMHGKPKVAHAPLPIPVRVLRESAPV
ncbi:MAG: hypothetical protein ACT4PZ_15550 [Panacagrimonas sp.]